MDSSDDKTCDVKRKSPRRIDRRGLWCLTFDYCCERYTQTSRPVKDRLSSVDSRKHEAFIRHRVCWIVAREVNEQAFFAVSRVLKNYFNAVFELLPDPKLAALFGRRLATCGKGRR